MRYNRQVFELLHTWQQGIIMRKSLHYLRNTSTLHWIVLCICFLHNQLKKITLKKLLKGYRLIENENFITPLVPRLICEKITKTVEADVIKLRLMEQFTIVGKCQFFAKLNECLNNVANESQAFI